MTKKEIIKAVSEKTGIEQKKVENVFNAILVQMSEELCSGNSIVIKDFGKFEKTIRKERKGINPKTKEPIQIPEKESVKFKPYEKIFFLRRLL